MKTTSIFLCCVLLFSIFISCEKSNESNDNTKEKLITKFVAKNYTVIGEIDQINNTIILHFGADADLNVIIPEITISSGATINPPSFQELNLSSPQQYIVTAADGSTQSYIVSAIQYTDTALMVIDLQNGYFPFYNDDLIVTNTNALISKARVANKTIIHIQTDYTSGDGGVESPLGTWEYEIAESLDPSPNEIYVMKLVPNSFNRESRLIKVLNENKIGSLVISGIATQVCVHETIKGGIKLGYRIIVAEDAHSSYNPEAQLRIEEYNSNIWPALGATVLKSDLIEF